MTKITTVLRKRGLGHLIEQQRIAHLAVLEVGDGTVLERLLDPTLAALFDLVHRAGVVVRGRQCPGHVGEVQAEAVGDSTRVEIALLDQCVDS